MPQNLWQISADEVGAADEARPVLILPFGIAWSPREDQQELYYSDSRPVLAWFIVGNASERVFWGCKSLHRARGGRWSVLSSEKFQRKRFPFFWRFLLLYSVLRTIAAAAGPTEKCAYICSKWRKTPAT